MSEMFEGIDTETLRTLHRQIGAKAIAVYADAACAVGTSTYDEIMAYGRQIHGAASLISTELDIRHAVYVAAAAERAAARRAAPGSAIQARYACPCGGELTWYGAGDTTAVCETCDTVYSGIAGLVVVSGERHDA
jgi:hypothetical protein